MSESNNAGNYAGEYTLREFEWEAANHKKAMEDGLEEAKRSGCSEQELSFMIEKGKVGSDEYGGVLHFLNNFYSNFPGGHHRDTVEQLAAFGKPEHRGYIDTMRKMFEDFDLTILGMGMTLDECREIYFEIRYRKDNEVFSKYKEFFVKLYIKMRNMGYIHKNLIG